MMNFGFYNMDCMEGMKQFPDKFFDLAIVDPPYGINADNFNNGAGYRDHGNGSTSNRVKKGRLNQGGSKLKGRVLNQSDCSWDSAPPTKEYFHELFRVSKNSVIWGGNYFDLPPTRGVIVWDKMQPWENFSQVEIAWTSFDKPAQLFKYRNTRGRNKIHPTQKPICLYEWILNKYANKNDIILDTHVGSASSLIACHRTNHRFVGFEIDETYYRDAKKRLDAEMAQMNIFDFLDRDR
jgi:site-specific DNA-methyltransferase (adenine-specific)